MKSKKRKNFVFVPGFKCNLDFYNEFIQQVSSENNVFQLEMDRHKKYSLKDYVNEAYYDIIKLNNLVDLSEIVVGGHSLGGGVAFELSRQMPNVKGVVGINPLSNTDYGVTGYATRGIKMGLKNMLNNPKWVLSMAKNILSTPTESYETIKDISTYGVPKVTKPTMILLSNKDEFFKKEGIPNKQFDSLKVVGMYGNHTNLDQKVLGNYVNRFMETI